MLGNKFDSQLLWQRILLSLIGVAMSGCLPIQDVRVHTTLIVDVNLRPAGGNSPSSQSVDTASPASMQGAESVLGSSAWRAPFNWSVNAFGDGFGGELRSKVPGQVCIQFDLAKISSNFSPIPIPFQAKTLSYFDVNTQQHVNWAHASGELRYSYRKAESPNVVRVDNSPEKRNLPLPRVCAAANKSSFASFWPVLEKLFPNGSMFNVKLRDQYPEVAESVAGNWIKIDVPIEYGGKREDIQIVLTAAGSTVSTRWELRGPLAF